MCRTNFFRVQLWAWMAQILNFWPKKTEKGFAPNDLRATGIAFWESPGLENLMYWFIFS